MTKKLFQLFQRSLSSITSKTAVITGGASGIGLSLAKVASLKGYNIILADIDENSLKLAKDTLNLNSSRLKTKVCNVSKENEIADLANFAFDNFGEVSLLCNNAGVGLAKLSWEHTTKDWDWVLGVNMWSIIHANRYFIPRMLKQPGRSRILNTASAAGLLSTPGMIAYNVSKHAVVTMSETLYHELKDLNANIDVSVLCPAFIPTGIAKSERNRPEDTKPSPEETAPTSEEHQQANLKYGMALLKAVKSGRITADEVAVEVFDAMEKDQFYIIPHKKILGGVHVRSEDITKLRPPTLLVPT